MSGANQKRQKRQKLSRRLSFNDAWQAIVDTREELTTAIQVLSGHKKKAISNALAALKSPTTKDNAHRRYVDFVYRVFVASGGGGFLVCVIALRKDLVVRMSNHVCDTVVMKMKENSEHFGSVRMISLLTRYEVPRSIEGMATSLRLTELTV